LSRNQLGSYAWRLAELLLGCMVYAAGLAFFALPNSIVAGGVTGVAMILNSQFGFPIGITVIVINIPLFAWAWRRFGTDFIVSSLLGVCISSLLVDFFSALSLAATTDPVLGSLYAGVIKGFGCGLIYRAGASLGGVDIVAKALRRRYPYINFGTLLLGLDGLVILAYALLQRNPDSTMYAIISMFIVTKMIDLVLYGPASARMCYIISEKSDVVKDAITEKLHRGVTMLHGVGAYSGLEKQVLLCVVKRQQVPEIREVVKQIDLAAFLIVTDARDVYGKGFENIQVVE